MLRASVGTKLLFFDLAEIANTRNIRQLVAPATKHPHNPILPLGDFDQWDSRRAAPWATRSVIYDREAGLFKMWYSGYPVAPGRLAIRPQRTGYATSEDGVSWEKPQLNLFEYEGDGKRNNICAHYIGGVVRDEAEQNPRRRYKMFLKKPPEGPAQNMGMAYSADGLSWGDVETLPGSAWGDRRFDTVAFLRDDQDPDPARRFKMVWQGRTRSTKEWGPDSVRDKHLAFGPDELHWQASAANPIISPNDGLENENHFLAYVPYMGQYLLLYEYGWYQPDGSGVFGRYCADIRMAHSRDGEHFTRICEHQKVIERGLPGEWDDQFLVMSDKIVIKNDVIYLYYAGQDRTWTSWPRENVKEGQDKITPAARITQTGVATLRLDRFTALETKDRETPGFAETIPIQLPPEPVELGINLSCAQPQRSWLSAEVLDADGGPLDGFGRAQSVALARDSVQASLHWRNHSLAKLAGQSIRLRLWLHGTARLHSVTWLPKQ